MSRKAASSLSCDFVHAPESEELDPRGSSSGLGIDYTFPVELALPSSLPLRYHLPPDPSHDRHPATLPMLFRQPPSLFSRYLAASSLHDLCPRDVATVLSLHPIYGSSQSLGVDHVWARLSPPQTKGCCPSSLSSHRSTQSWHR